MSIAITKQCLKHFDDDLYDTTTKKGKGKRSSSKPKYQSVTKGGITKKSKFTKKSIIDEYREQKTSDYTNESLLALQKLSKCGKLSTKVTETILDHNRGKLAKNQPVLEAKKDTGTVFTDKDFERFEKEFDFS